MLSKKEQIKLASELLKISEEEAEKNCRELIELNAIYVCIPIIGEEAIIVGPDGSVLYAISSVPPSKHLEEYKKGRRTPIEEFYKNANKF